MRSRLTTEARAWGLVALAVMLSWAVATPASASEAPPAGAVDPQFAGGGVRALPAGSVSAGRITTAARDGLGGIVGAGFAFDGEDAVLSVVQRDATGAPVVAFAGDGEARVKVPLVPPLAIAIGRQPSGRTIVLALDGTRSVLVALTVAGNLDAGFASDGVLELDTTPVARPAAFAIDALGRILLAGQGPRVLRLTSAGAPDATFGSGGIAPVDLPSDSWLLDLAAGPLGDVVVSAVPDPQRSFFQRGTAVVHLSAAGEQDAEFGEGGVATVAETEGELTHQLLLRPGGGIVLADGGRVHAVTAAGTPDRGFSGDGRLDLGPGAVYDIALDGLGRLYVARDENASDGREITRFGTDGAPDADFGEVSMPEFGFGHMTLLGEPTGVLGAGDAHFLPARPMYGAQGLLSRLTADGSHDPVLGPLGRLVAMGRTTAGFGRAVAAGADGRAILVGSGYEDHRRRLYVARVLADGTPDPSFGIDGRALLDHAHTDVEGLAVALDGDRPVVAGGRGAYGLLVARFTAGGEPDVTFGPGGVRELAVPGMQLSAHASIAVDGAGARSSPGRRAPAASPRGS